MRTKHTPGPWVADINNYDPEWIIGPDGFPVAIVRHEDGQPFANGVGFTAKKRGVEETEANAQLIAASPTMLREMLRYLPVLERIEKDVPEVWAEITQGTGIATLNGYREAIKKAGGQL